MELVPFDASHRDEVLALSMRAWEPVFPLMEDAIPGYVYESFYPAGWRDRQWTDLDDVLSSEPENVDVAIIDGLPVGWVCTRLHPADDMGEVYVIAVDPAHQQRGVGRALLEQAFSRARRAGMRMIMVETGDDPGHAPGRRAYESVGFERYPVARYFKDLSD